MTTVGILLRTIRAPTLLRGLHAAGDLLPHGATVKWMPVHLAAMFRGTGFGRDGDDAAQGTLLVA